ncbi:MAG: hypothetical protein DRR16_28975 [Candidatus Parabeggiatoa sp. nov. 3]|jgi:rare lipoprotein A|nr:MAG: hypothetical protein DRR00_05440 [Gammaproteobacteria bacterium]RKZ61492.1 MAG: hypothetical protein DRQ99_20390 [Gammaproteobacteria bacterium]RKZ77792.1 MAG: hypothetical protein DRR16_28975 [Gammaproteobacteria bacterium]HEW98465.1 hypothetical protein [Beggiatoa sp.]
MPKPVKFSLIPVGLLALLVELSGCAQVATPSSAPHATAIPSVPAAKYRTASYWHQDDFKAAQQYRRTLPESYVSQGYATWYTADEHGAKTASGQIYDLYGMTAAHATLPLFSRVKVKNLRTGRSIKVTINDDFDDNNGSLIKLSYWAARRLGLIKRSSQRIEISVQ